VTKSCEKQGCNEPAEVAFGIDRIACVVWLETFDDDKQHHVNRLCDEHASRLTLPRGWTFDDRREKSPRLFVAARPPVSNTKPPASNVKPLAKPLRKAEHTAPKKIVPLPRRTSRDVSAPVKRASGPGLFDPTLPMNSPVLRAPVLNTPVDDTADVRADRPVDAPGDAQVEAPVSDAQYAPKFDRTSDVGGALNARGRLLARAFSSQTKPIERPEQPANTDSLPQGDHIDDFNQGEHVE
jgi:hypothetical protein